MIFKNSDYTANINNSTVEVKKNNTNFYSEDKGTAQIRVYVNLNGKKLNLTDNGLTPQLDLFLADGSIFKDEPLELVNPSIGLVQYKIPDKVIKHVGAVNCKLFLKGTNQKVHVANFSFNILDSGVEGAVEKEISVNLVEDTVRKIIQDEAMDLLDDDFKSEVFEGFQTYVTENVEQFKGAQGDIGPVGPQGERGEVGATGATGEQGPKGDKGEQGEQGLQGEVGPRGIQGVPGATGPKGEQGEKGEQGIQGPKGDTGEIPNTDNWQKYKLTPDNGQLGYDTLNDDLVALRALDPGFYYRTGVPITGASSTAGFVTVEMRDAGLKRITFRPYNSPQSFLMRFYNEWHDWERVDNAQSDTGWIPFTLINGALSNVNYKNAGENGFDCAYRTIKDGTVTKRIVRLNGKKVSHGQTIAQLPPAFCKNDQTFPIRVPVKYSGAFVTIKNTGDVNIYIQGDRSNWNEEDLFYGEFTWHD